MMPLSLGRTLCANSAERPRSALCLGEPRSTKPTERERHRPIFAIFRWERRNVVLWKADGPGTSFRPDCAGIGCLPSRPRFGAHWSAASSQIDQRPPLSNLSVLPGNQLRTGAFGPSILARSISAPGPNIAGTVGQRGANRATKRWSLDPAQSTAVSDRCVARRSLPRSCLPFVGCWRFGDDRHKLLE